MINMVDDAAEAVTLEKRLNNWRRTVLYVRGGRGSACAFWAELYLKSRASEKEAAVAPAPPRADITVEELDGWMVEAAWKAMLDFDEKQALKFWFVHQYPEHWIKRKLGLRRLGVPLLLARAKVSLKKNLDKFADSTTIGGTHSRAPVTRP